MFSEITLHDFTRPLVQRKAARRHVGPYRWRPAKPGAGRSFYLSKGGIQGGTRMEACGLDLRVSEADEHLPSGSRLARIHGYFIDRHCDETISPIVIALPHGRGFFAGWTLGEGMASTLDPHIWGTAEEAAMSAHDIAERAAEDERDYRDRYDENEDD